MPVISLSLEKEFIEKLDKLAEKLDRNRSDTVKQLIKEVKI